MQHAGRDVPAGADFEPVRNREIGDLVVALFEIGQGLTDLGLGYARLEAEAERDGKRIEFFEEKKKRAEADRDEFLEDVLLITRDLEDGRARLDKLAAELEAGRAEAAAADDSLREARTRLREKEKLPLPVGMPGCGWTTPLS